MVQVGMGKVNNSASVGSVRRVLVIFPGSLGDFICFLPALQAIGRKYPREMVELIGRREVVQLAGDWLLVAAIHSIDRCEVAQLFSPTDGVNKETSRFFSRFRAVYSWTAYGDAHFAAKLKNLVEGPVATFPFCRGQGEEHTSTHYLRCLREPQRPFPQLSPGAEELRWAESYWQDQGLGSSPVLVLHPGSGSLRKQWDLPGFEEVARWWTKEKVGEVVVILGPAEEEKGLRWREKGYVTRGLSLSYLAALLYKATAYIGNDSGVSHLAGVMDAAGVIIFGPTDPRQWRPLGGRLVVVRNEEFRRSFPGTAGISLLEIPPQEVIHRLAQASYLDKGGG